MKSVAALILAFATIFVSVEAGTRLVRQSGWGSPPPSPSPGWGSPPSPGWSGPAPVDIEMEGESGTVAIGSGISEHNSAISVTGSVDTPASLSLNTGSSVSLYQSAGNYQSTQVDQDGSSYGYQGNFASNSGSAYDFLWANAEGLDVNAENTGWSALQGQGTVGQNDNLSHQGREQVSE